MDLSASVEVRVLAQYNIIMSYLEHNIIVSSLEISNCKEMSGWIGCTFHTEFGSSSTKCTVSGTGNDTKRSKNRAVFLGGWCMAMKSPASTGIGSSTVYSYTLGQLVETD